MSSIRVLPLNLSTTQKVKIFVVFLHINAFFLRIVDNCSSFSYGGSSFSGSFGKCLGTSEGDEARAETSETNAEWTKDTK